MFIVFVCNDCSNSKVDSRNFNRVSNSYSLLPIILYYTNEYNAPSFLGIMFSLCIFECRNHAFLSMILIGAYSATTNSHNV